MTQQKPIIVRSKKDAQDFLLDQPWAAISIATRAKEFAKLSEGNRVGLLQLEFWDISNSRLAEDEKVRPHLFTVEQAQQILDFAKEVWDKVDCLLVHCEAGLSRSPAIAAALAHIYYGKGEEQVYFNRFIPNSHVYTTLLKLHYGADENFAVPDREVFWKSNEKSLPDLDNLDDLEQEHIAL